MECFKCGFEQPDATTESSRCGLVFAKWQQTVDPAVRRRQMQREIAEVDRVEDGRIGRKELMILGFGLAAAIIVYLIPIFRFLFSALVTLFHELGHAVAAWLMGYPALPAFDFVYGGGFTHYGTFKLPLALMIAAGFGYLGWLFRRNWRTLAVIGTLFVVWLIFVSAEWRRELLMAAAGHAFEFILAGILFYQALSGSGWRIPEIERPLGAFVAFFVQIHSMHFALKLRNDPDFLAWYREGKGGMLMNDLEQVALDLHIHLGLRPGIEGVAALLLLFSFVPLLAGLFWHLQRSRCHSAVRALLAT